MPKQTRLWLTGLTLIFLLLAGVILSRIYREQVYTPVRPGSPEKLSFTVEKGARGAQIADALFQKGLIRSPLFFRLYLRLANGGHHLIQAGQYELSPSQTLAEIVSTLGHGTFDLKLTLIEGWRKEEYALYLKEKFGANFAKAFLADPQAKEGYLFPDTYFVERSVSPSQLVSLLRANFDKKVTQQLKQGFVAQGLTLAQGVILASIVEREAQSPEDRPLVAGILIKRFKNGLALEADATTQFAIASEKLKTKNTKLAEVEWWKKDLTKQDLQIDSPYNTRKTIGLPPGPIANPGLSSLQAVAHPQPSENWYYLSDHKGQIYYSKTLQEHNQKIEKYLN